uniref:Secreted protein n=1 Tax=Ascaris lumbricoides TaxID=6252 RepID=A0A0M3HW16_ASCLU
MNCSDCAIEVIALLLVKPIFTENNAANESINYHQCIPVSVAAPSRFQRSKRMQVLAGGRRKKAYKESVHL